MDRRCPAVAVLCSPGVSHGDAREPRFVCQGSAVAALVLLAACYCLPSANVGVSDRASKRNAMSMGRQFLCSTTPARRGRLRRRRCSAGPSLEGSRRADVLHDELSHRVLETRHQPMRPSESAGARSAARRSTAVQHVAACVPRPRAAVVGRGAVRDLLGLNPVSGPAGAQAEVDPLHRSGGQATPRASRQAVRATQPVLVHLTERVSLTALCR